MSPRAPWSDWDVDWDKGIATRVSAIPGAPAWLVAVSFAADPATGAVGLAQLRVFPRHGKDALPPLCDSCLQLVPELAPPSAHALTATALRSVHLGALQHEATRELRDIGPIILPSPRAFQSIRKQRRGARRERHLAYLAALYVQECLRVRGRRPFVTLSEKL